MPTRKITISDAEVREAVIQYMYDIGEINARVDDLISAELITFTHNPSTQTISAEVTIKSE